MALAKGRRALLVRDYRGSYPFSLWNHPYDKELPSLREGLRGIRRVFVVLSLLWGWGIDRRTPDLYDGIGAAICLVGVSVILWSPRN